MTRRRKERLVAEERKLAVVRSRSKARIRAEGIVVRSSSKARWFEDHFSRIGWGRTVRGYREIRMRMRGARLRSEVNNSE